MSRGCRGSRPTAPSANMRGISGTCRCVALRHWRCRNPARSARRPAERHCEPTGRNDGSTEMLTTAPHLFDEATRVTAGDSCWQGRTSEDYWAFVGPFGGVTAATMLRALLDHTQRAGDQLSLNVKFCAPIERGPFDLDVRLIKANRSTQHWSVERPQDGAEV